MSRPSLMLAKLDASNLMTQLHHFMESSSNQFLVMFGAIALVAILGGTWAAIYSLKKKKHKHHGPRAQSHGSGAEVSSQTKTTSEPRFADGKMQHGSQRRRRSRPTMNPTLAQTRGLPPMRDKNAPLPPMP